MRLRQFPVDPTPRLQLAHPTGDIFDLHPITTTRPAAGTVDTAMTCPRCDATVPLRLSSAEWVHSRRHHQFAVGTTVLLLGLAAGVLLITLDLRRDWGGGPFTIGFLLILLTAGGVGSYFRESREEDGVVSLDPGHTLREPGDTVDYVDHDGGNFEAVI